MNKLFLLPLLFMAGCTGTAQPLHKPDNTITVAPDASGHLTAIGPKCEPYSDALVDRYANDPLPQLGCSTANNLAAMIANPADLVRGELPLRPEGHANAEVESAATTRYELGKVYAPISPTTGSGGSGATAAQ